MKYTREIIKKQFRAGKKKKYLFFWGHQPSLSKEVTSSCLSQWYHTSFIVNGRNYPTTEHFMMAEKARLFLDAAAEKRILLAKSPGEAKEIGRQVRHFDQATWEAKRFAIVVEGNMAKFSQNEGLKTFLIQTKKRVLVEASPVDRIWGIGLAKESKEAQNSLLWRGDNLLGFALMEVRDCIGK